MSADHAGFVIAAYGVAFATIAAVIAAVMIDYRAQRRALAALERRLPPERRRQADRAR